MNPQQPATHGDERPSGVVVRWRSGRFPTGWCPLSRGKLLACGRKIAQSLILLAVASSSTLAEDEAPGGAGDVPADHAVRMQKGLEIFKAHVRTILVDRCVSCHGGDTLEGEFNLATRKGLLRGGATGAALAVDAAKGVRFDRSAESLMVRLITHAEQPHMPYEEEKLTDEEISQISLWIDHGAPYDKPLVADAVEAIPWTERVVPKAERGFWSFQPLRNVSPPQVRDEETCRSAIDCFVQARLEAKGIEPNGEVDRRRLIRRAYYDLLGLPPDPKIVEQFVSDPAPDAYPRLLDRLLASPHYGERWGRHWLDISRFAESHGFEHDTDRASAYHFRDFVIRALNDDMPYDTFVKWQLAGDELAPEENLAMMATGFLAAGVHSTQITKNEVEKHRYDELDDMIATAGTAMLGLTVGCARCHDHKFDPIPQRDYYQLLSAFSTTVRSEVDLNFDKRGYAEAKARFDAEHAPLAAELSRFEAERLPARFVQWEESQGTAAPPNWIVPEVASHKAAGDATFSLLDDDSLLAAGEVKKSDTYTLRLRTDLASIRAIRLDALPHPSLPGGGPGRATKGGFGLSELQLTAQPAGDESAKPAAVKLRAFQTGDAQTNQAVASAIDGDRKSTWLVESPNGTRQSALFETTKPVGFEGGTLLTCTLKFEPNTLRSLGRLRLSVSGTTQNAAANDRPVPENVVRMLAVPREKRSTEQTPALLRWYRHLDPQWQQLDQPVQEHLRIEPRPDMATVLVSSEGLKAVRLHTQGEDFFEQTYFLRRGDPNLKRGVAPLGFLQVLMRVEEEKQPWIVEPPEGARTSFRRTSVANWMTDVQHGAGHLLARVIVNRMWRHHLGSGIVRTPSDFGNRGEPPTHPELLDWLAGELVRHNWQLKPVHKQLMLSSLYRRSSDLNDEKFRLDESNSLFWRRERHRLEAEVIRDALLAVSGSLDERMFGAGTLDPEQSRRSIYFTMKRSKLVPMMQVFDAPDALSGMGRRPSTTIAPQALLLMNNPVIRERARGFARRMALPSDDSPDDVPNELVQQAYLAALGRPPDAEELIDSIGFIKHQAESYAADGQTGGRETALCDLCHALMCLNEFVYVE